MKVSKQAKVELQKTIEEQLKSVPEGQRINLDNELLEELLFDKYVIDEEKGVIVKIPIWSGEVLRKIDLSKISFENVMLGFWEDRDWKDIILDKETSSIIDKYFDYYDENNMLDYSYTNANIDLTKIFGANFNKICLEFCNLKGTDMSSQDLSNSSYIRINGCNVSDTSLSIPEHVKLVALGSDFSNIDLSSRAIDGNAYLDDLQSTNLPSCCLANTGIYIEFNEARYNEYNRGGSEEYIQKRKDTLAKNWAGCYINGRIYNGVERPNPQKEQLISSIIESIEEQVNGFKIK